MHHASRKDGPDPEDWFQQPDQNPTACETRRNPVDGDARMYLGSSPAELGSFDVSASASVIERVRSLAEWAEELKCWIESHYESGDQAWLAVCRASNEYHTEWLQKSGDLLEQAQFDLSHLPKGDEQTKRFKRAYGRVVRQLPTQIRTELRAEIGQMNLNSFQRFTALLAVLRRAYDARTHEEQVRLERKLERPTDWIQDRPGNQWFIQLQSWLTLVHHASNLGHVQWRRVVLGVLEVQNTVLKQLTDIHKIKIASWGDRYGINSNTENADDIVSYMRAIAALCRTNPEILRTKGKENANGKGGTGAPNKPSAIFTKKGGFKASGKGGKSGKTAGKSECFVCGKPRGEHADVMYCKRRGKGNGKPMLCFVCNKPSDAHTNKTFCQRTGKGNGKSPNGASPL